MESISQIPKLRPRAVDAHKGDFGKVCIIAGSIGMSGAAALAGRAALRCGAGLVRVAAPRSVLPIVASIEPSFTTIALPEDGIGRISAKAINTILDVVGDNDVLAFGPGVGVSGELRSILMALLEQDGLRLIIDADGLNNFDATVLGVYIHGLAGDIAAEKTGQVSLMTTDIIKSLPDAFMRDI